MNIRSQDQQGLSGSTLVGQSWATLCTAVRSGESLTRTVPTGSEKFNEPGVEYSAYVEPTTAAWRDAWKLTERLILMMREEVLQKHARFVVVTLSSAFQVDPDRNIREQFMRKLGITDPFYPDRRIADFAKANSFEVISLAEPFMNEAERKNVYLHGSPLNVLGKGHWNSNGHRLAAELVGDYLVKTSRSDAPFLRSAAERR